MDKKFWVREFRKFLEEHSLKEEFIQKYTKENPDNRIGEFFSSKSPRSYIRSAFAWGAYTTRDFDVWNRADDLWSVCIAKLDSEIE